MASYVDFCHFFKLFLLILSNFFPPSRNREIIICDLSVVVVVSFSQNDDASSAPNLLGVNFRQHSNGFALQLGSGMFRYRAQVLKCCSFCRNNGLVFQT